MTVATIGTQSRVLIENANPPTLAYEYVSCSMAKRQQVLSTDGIRATRSHPVERTAAGTYTCSGSVVMHPGHDDLSALKGFVLGTSGALTETMPTFYMGVDRVATAASQYLYTGCVVDKATLRGSQGGLVEMTLDIEALTETAGAISGLTGRTPALTKPFAFSSAVLTIGGTAYQFREFTLTIDNMIKKDRWMNSVSRTDLPSLDRMVGVSLSLPFTSDTLARYDTNETSVAVVITLTDAASATATFTMAAVQFPTESPPLPGREEILLPYNGIARKTGSTLELVMALS